MKLYGKWIFLDNHTLENLNQMYNWSNNKELIEIECGKINKISNIDEYKNEIMASYIENNHESNSTFCHFGIHRRYNNEFIGYLDFQNINENNAELSLSIPEINYRNKHYGIDATIIALEYAFKIRKIKNIIIRTRKDNLIVKNICQKIGLKYIIEHFSENNYNIDLIKYEIDYDLFKSIVLKIFKKNVFEESVTSLNTR